MWIGHAKHETAGAIKLPATMVLANRLPKVPDLIAPVSAVPAWAYPEISYRRDGAVGLLTFDFYNGAMSTWQCRRLLAALRYAVKQDTTVLVLRGGHVFSNGIHLNVIEAANQQAAEAWRNINAINDVCREIITCKRQLVISAGGGNAGAGGVMLALGADRVVVRDGAVLNPHYASMGLFGSEYWTYVLPRRVGAQSAERLTTDCLPIDASTAAELGLADAVLPGGLAEFDQALMDYAARLASDKASGHSMPEPPTKPLDAYRAEELAEMSRDLFNDRNGFADLRRAFVTKRRPAVTPKQIAGHRPARPVEPERPSVSTTAG